MRWRGLGTATAVALSLVLAGVVTNDLALAAATSSSAPPGDGPPRARTRWSRPGALWSRRRPPRRSPRLRFCHRRRPPPPPPTTPPRGQATAYRCAAALAYLQAYAAPGFVFHCPGTADGRQAMTCVNHPPECGPGQDVVGIADPCAAVYVNEASNSWVLIGRSDAPIDPYGWCTT